MSTAVTTSWKYLRTAPRPWRAIAIGGRTSGLSLNSAFSMACRSQIDGSSVCSIFSDTSSCLRLRSFETVVGRYCSLFMRTSSLSSCSRSPTA